MDFDFNSDQIELRNAVARWMEKEYSPTRRRKIVLEGGFAKEVWSSFADLGLLGLNIGDEHGGMGMGAIESMVVMEEFGRNAVLEPLAQAFMTSQTIAKFASKQIQENWLPAIASGDAVVTLAYQERAARYRLDVCEATAVLSKDDEFQISGTKDNVPAGDLARAFLVPARIDGKLALFIVEREQQGVTTQSYSTLDGARSASVKFEHAKGSLIALDGFDALEWAVGIGIAASCAEAVGAMETALKMTVGYLTTRQQFGAPLATLQALRHRVADMKMQVELARSMSYYASLRLHDEPSLRRLALSQAKYQLSQSMQFVGKQAVQLHGGIGVTDEYDLSFYFKRLTQVEMTFGDGLHHLAAITEMQFA